MMKVTLKRSFKSASFVGKSETQLLTLTIKLTSYYSLISSYPLFILGKILRSLSRTCCNTPVLLSQGGPR